MFQADEDTILYTGGGPYDLVTVVLMVVIKPWDTSIPKQLLFLFFVDGSGWMCLTVYGYHEIGYFDCDGFLLVKANDDTNICYRGGTAYVSIFLLCWFLGSHDCHQNMWDVHTQAIALTDALMAWVGRLSCFFHGCHDFGFLLSTFGFSRQTNTPSSVLLYLLLQ